MFADITIFTTEILPGSTSTRLSLALLVGTRYPGPNHHWEDGYNYLVPKCDKNKNQSISTISLLRCQHPMMGTHMPTNCFPGTFTRQHLGSKYSMYLRTYLRQYVLEDISVSEEGEIIELPREDLSWALKNCNTEVGSEEKEKTSQAKYGETV